MTTLTQLQHSEIENSQHNLDIVLIAEGLTSPANYGMMIRTAEAFGVREIVFVSPEQELTPKMKRASRSAEKYINIQFVTDCAPVLAQFKASGYDILALERTNQSISINQFVAKSNKIVLIVGNESIGVSEQALSFCHIAVEIPMYGKNSSMNVVVATGVALNILTKKNI